MAIYLLRALSRKLSTADRLSNFNVKQVNLTQLCKLMPEPIAHLFFECPYSSYIWSVSKRKLGLNQNIDTLGVEAKQVRDVFKTRSKSSVLAKFNFCWRSVAHMEWNCRIFAQQEIGKVERFKMPT